MVKKADQRTYAFSVDEASEAFAQYIRRKTGEDVSKFSGLSIGINQEKNFVTWTISLEPTADKKDVVVVANNSGVLN